MALGKQPPGVFDYNEGTTINGSKEPIFYAYERRIYA